MVLPSRRASATELRPFDVARTRLGDIALLVSRTGFTGDLGYELFCAPGDALALWDALYDTPVAARLLPIGSHALNMARIEAGFLQVNVDFIGSQAVLRRSQARSPFALSLDWLVHLDKGPFVGRRALLAERAAGGPRRRVVGLDIAGTKPASESFLYDGRHEVGLVTSALWSPTCKRNIALAELKAPYGGRITENLWAEIYVQQEGRWDRRLVPVRIVTDPFLRNDRARATPPRPF